MRNRSVPLVIAALLAACSPSTSTAQPSTPPAPPAGRGRMEPALDGRLEAPPGFKVSHFAPNVRRARAMALGPDGSVYVSQPGEGQVTRLVDANGDGVAERQDTVLRGLNRPHGMAFRDGYLWIANTDGVVRGEALVEALATLGFDHQTTVAARTPTRQVIEVFRHPATIALFGLERTLKYKARHGRDMPTRLQAWQHYQAHLGALEQADPPLHGQAPLLEQDVSLLRGRREGSSSAPVVIPQRPPEESATP